MLKGSQPNKIDNWICILERGTEHEVNLAKSYLDSLKIPSNILSKKDSSMMMNFGELSMVYLYVPGEFEKKARKALREVDEINKSDASDDNGDQPEDSAD